MNHHEEALTGLLSDLRILRELELSEPARRWLDMAIGRAEEPEFTISNYAASMLVEDVAMDTAPVRYVAPDEARDSEELWCRPQ